MKFPQCEEKCLISTLCQKDGQFVEADQVMGLDVQKVIKSIKGTADGLVSST